MAGCNLQETNRLRCNVQITDEDEDCPEETLDLQSQLRRLYETNDGSDVTFELKDSRNNVVSFPAHKTILFMKSRYFKRLFENDPSSTFELPEIDPEGFRNILRYIYLNDLEDLMSSGNFIQTAYAARVLQMNSLTLRCFEHLLKSTGSSYSKFEVALNLGGRYYELFCNYIFISLYEKKFLVKANEAQINLFFKWFSVLDSMKNYPAREVFNLVHMWAIDKCGNAGLAEVRQKMQPFLQYIEFLTMTSKEFMRVVLPTRVLNPNEIDAIAANLENEDRRVRLNLPDWCSLCYEVYRAEHYFVLVDPPSRIFATNGNLVTSGADIVPITSETVWTLKFTSNGCSAYIKSAYVLANENFELGGVLKVDGVSVSELSSLRDSDCSNFSEDPYLRKAIFVYPKKIVRLNEGRSQVEITLSVPRSVVLPASVATRSSQYYTRPVSANRRGLFQIDINPATDGFCVDKLNFGFEKKCYLSMQG